jgi:hypothetical protein
MHPATDQCTDYTADETADGGAYRSGYLRRFVDAPCRLYFAVGSASWGRAGVGVGWRLVGVVSICHVSPAPRF